MEFLGMRIEYSKMQKRWFVMDYDYELGWHDVGSFASKTAAINWISQP